MLRVPIFLNKFWQLLQELLRVAPKFVASRSMLLSQAILTARLLGPVEPLLPY
jgi:hypothetical protein